MLTNGQIDIDNPECYFCIKTKGETITRVNGNVSFFAGKRLQNF